jgi:hypothetical protein
VLVNNQKLGTILNMEVVSPSQTVVDSHQGPGKPGGLEIKWYIPDFSLC